MKAIIFMSFILLFQTAALTADDAQPANVPQVEIVFTLDTTGSMSGLIEGAKQKIWWIANQVIQGQPRPEFKIGLVGYRDKGDTYITQVYDLNDDLDEVYQNLLSFQAEGGGDTPEHVNQALHESLNNISWSASRDVLKMVFLVGDAPPHTDYDDGFNHQATCRDAATRDIIINTIQCGSDPETENYWNEIAKLSEGEFARVDQSGGMRMIPTPMDGDLAALGAELNSTFLIWGNEELRDDEALKCTAVAALPVPMAAERAAYISRKGKLGDADLIDAVESGEVNLATVKAELLPEQLRGLSHEQMENYLQDISNKRRVIEEKIESLRQNRDEYLRHQLAKIDSEDAFDLRIVKMIRHQAGRKGIAY
ncbi:MAG: VWA domain-containing protein [Candidatus Eisenbacteria bacterium]|uniref:VWA domain-containing protein n=1 Tax=Eiseniibacteriota bacterium TaxID=2212470 RepID=A0A948RY53_UNCEI|nr:VWA domain-containing protein [Candidatus Eisenbacteria bacterium]MBU1949978.1 VWA domain-containing protein [Candidatus Eisenbacteria bacterium]MBU2692116.1 VWA domain-containing protein [Candidatus Eisenbacteria bacterium]